MTIKLNSPIEDFYEEYSHIIQRGITGELEYKLDFLGKERINENFSQAGQDIFVISCLDGKTGGKFLDLGCNNPIRINNTFLLEKKFLWEGLSIDIDKTQTDLFKGVRNSDVLTQDCTKLDFDYIIEKLQTSHIDYLSLDLEPASITFECLESIPFKKLEFSLITFEHDSYRFGDSIKEKSRSLFNHFGYKAICEDVKNNLCEYEDWYYNPKYVDFERIKCYSSKMKDWSEILFQH